MYDFHKTRNGSNHQCFQHSLFLKGRKDLLVDIKRKNSSNDRPSKQAPSRSKFAPSPSSRVTRSNYVSQTDAREVDRQRRREEKFSNKLPKHFANPEADSSSDFKTQNGVYRDQGAVKDLLVVPEGGDAAQRMQSHANHQNGEAYFP
jgi:hypothetical protein